MRHTASPGFVFLLALLLSAFAHAAQPAVTIPQGVDSEESVSSGRTLLKIINDALNGRPGAVRDYGDWLEENNGRDIPDAEALRGGSGREREMVERLDIFAALIADARMYAETVLGNPGYEAAHFHELIVKALAADADKDGLAVDAVEEISRAWRGADELLRGRENLFRQYQDELRRGKAADGTRLAWSLIRIGAASEDTRIKPGSFRYDDRQAEITVVHMGENIAVRATADDYRNHIRATIDGYRFRTGWAVLFQKPLGWMAATAKALRAAGVRPDQDEEWEIMEAPQGLIALAMAPGGSSWEYPKRAFFRGETYEAVPVPPPADAGRMKEEFHQAARALRDGVMDDDSIPQPIRQALRPILEGTYQEVDPRDYFDNDFCRRLVEADYLERIVLPLPPGRARELAAYRAALAKVEAGYDRFALDLGGQGRLVAVTRPDLDVKDGDVPDVRDAETGETVSRYQWRWEAPDATYFHSPLPARYLYALSVLEKYDGAHRQRPAGVPARTEVWHAVLGRLAGYDKGAPSAEGDAGRWLEAVRMDAQGRRESNSGPLGWDFPLFVPVRDDQGDPVLLATLDGTLESPDFSAVLGADARRAAQDDWLDRAAALLGTPGELNLIYQQFFRYCSDSPLPEMPNLIGSHYGLSDTHQTVYQSLDRRWVGRLIGDCDDLAEFYQVLAARQGKLAHVMQLPAHAAAGYLEKNPDGDYQFVVFQTGPLLRFADATREGAVEKAYRHFENEVGGTHFTLAAVPLLLRFGGEDTRTPFVLSARIYWDREYAEKMIEVQEYWHLHTYSAGVGIMEEMLLTDREPGSIKELASLYERLGDYDKSLALRREELAVAGSDPLAQLSALLDIAQLHEHGKNKLEALDALSGMESLLSVLREDQPSLYARALSFRSSWALLLTRLGEPEMAWSLLQHDVEDAWRRDVGFSDTLLRTLVNVYDKMSVQRDSPDGPEASKESMRVRYLVRGALSHAFGKGYFKANDAYNKIHSRYYWLGRYGVAVAGRRAGLESLWRDGPYPTAPREHELREEDLSEADWEWFRILPRLYLSYGLEMLDRRDYPDLYDPVGARKSLELVRRAIEKGEAYGSETLGRDALVRSELLLSFLNRDLDAFDRIMTMVRSKDYASLYDDAAVSFGMYCGLIPRESFPAWIEAFHRFFPGRQHYFKAAYRAMDKEHFDHAAMLAEATARFFPDDAVLVGEAGALTRSVERLRKLKKDAAGEKDWASGTGAAGGEDDASSWLHEIVDVTEAIPAVMLN